MDFRIGNCFRMEIFAVFLILVTTCHGASIYAENPTHARADKVVQEYYRSSGSLKVQWDCDLCKLGVGFIQTLAEERKSWNDIAEAVTYLCIKLNIEDKNVCDHIIPLFKDEVLTVLDKLYLGPKDVCGKIFGESCGHGYDPSQMWNVTLPNKPKPPVKPVPPPKKGSPKLNVLHLSDIHIDMQYTEGANAKCGEPICCRNKDEPVIEAAGKWGHHGDCDLPPRTLENLFQHLSTNHTIDYIVWTGDLPAHYVWLTSQNDTSYLLHYLTNMFLKYFPHTPVYSTLGNHEGVPVNSFPPNWKLVPEPDSSRWLYGNLSETWTPWLPNTTRDTILKAGFYAAQVKPGLRMISLNNNLCNNQNWWLMLNETDPEGQLQWLIAQLQDAEDKGDKVQMIGHIPPGTGSCVKAWSWNFYKIVNRYESTIVGQFYGHVHKDEFEIFYDPESNFTRATSVGYQGPSVEAGNSGNSGYKIYTLDGHYNGSSYAVLDMEVHIFNLTEANQPGHSPKWYKEYSAKDAYNLTSLQPSDWDKFVKRMETDDNLFQKFYKYWYKSYVDVPPCDASCKQRHLCGFRSARSYDPDLCRNYTLVYGAWDKHLQYMRDTADC